MAIVVDDASTDGEQDIIKKWADENCSLLEQDETSADYIYCFYHHRENTNFWLMLKLLKYNHFSIKKAKVPYFLTWMKRTPYSAFCEGDDYWIDPEKLSRQVQYLDSDIECGMVYTRCYRSENGKSREDIWGGPKTKLKELLFDNTIPTLTVVVRNEVEFRYFDDVRPDTHGWKMGDYPRWLWYAAESKIGFLDNPTSVYRVLPESASHSRSLKKMLAFADNFYDIKHFFDQKYNLGMSRRLEQLRCSHKLARISRAGDLGRFRAVWVQAIGEDVRNLLKIRNWFYSFRCIGNKLHNMIWGKEQYI